MKNEELRASVKIFRLIRIVQPVQQLASFHSFSEKNFVQSVRISVLGGVEAIQDRLKREL